MLKYFLNGLFTFFLGFSSWTFGQFTVIPTGTIQSITGLDVCADTLFITGEQGYFGKMVEQEEIVFNMNSISPSGYVLIDFQIIDSNKYYALAVQGSPYEHNYILKSNDFGTSWVELYDTTGLFYSLTMLDSSFGILGGTFGGFAMTVGNDTSWAMDTLYSVLFASDSFEDSTMIILSNSGASFLTNDRGQTWIWGTCISERTMQVKFQNKDTIYSIANGGGSLHSYFSYSYNGGVSFVNTWIGYNLGTSQYEFTSRLYDMHFDTENHGYLLGYVYDSTMSSVNQAVIFETNDYGITWTPNIIGFTEELYSLEFINDSTAFIGGQNGLLLKWDLTIPLSNVLKVDEQNGNTSLVEFFPNPVRDGATFVLDEKVLPVTVIVTNQIGQTVQTEFLSSEISAISFAALPNGIYYYCIGEIRGQFIVSK